MLNHCFTEYAIRDFSFLNEQAFFSAFVKLRQATTSYVMSVYSSVCPSAWNNSAPTGRIFMKFDVCVFSKICRENSSFIKIRQE
jgi:hypothetical protein